MSWWSLRNTLPVVPKNHGQCFKKLRATFSKTTSNVFSKLWANRYCSIIWILFGRWRVIFPQLAKNIAPIDEKNRHLQPSHKQRGRDVRGVARQGIRWKKLAKKFGGIKNRCTFAPAIEKRRWLLSDSETIFEDTYIIRQVVQETESSISIKSTVNKMTLDYDERRNPG